VSGVAEIYRNLLESMEQGALVLTANRRLFRYLRDLYDEGMLHRGRSAWPPPQLLSYEAWLQRCLAELGEQWRLITPLQLQYLWEQQIDQASRAAGLDLLQVPRTAERAIQAYRLLNEYELELEPLDLTEDQDVFRKWLTSFQKLAAEHQWLDKSQLARRIRDAFRARELTAPVQVKLVGFDQLPPGLLMLQQFLVEAGCSCEEVALGDGPAQDIIRFGARDRTGEVEAAACWARALLDSGEAAIGVVVPDLTRRRQEIERVFRAQIDPLGATRLNDEDAVFSLSLGGPLSDQGVIHAALEILQVGRVVTLEQASFLLRSPYLGKVQGEEDRRALFEVQLRGYDQQRFATQTLARQAEKAGLRDFSRILQLLSGPDPSAKKKAPGVWCECFANLLRDIGWPGERALASREYQAIKSWQENVLEQIPHLDALGQPMSRQRVLSLVQRLSHETEFQIEAPTGPVQVVGLLESTGLRFEHLWVMGLEERILPAAPQPNPFLPYRLQVAHAMPHSSADRELLYAEQVMARLLGAAEHVVVSYPRFDGDTELQPSPLLPEQAAMGSPALADRHDLLQLLGQNPVVLEVVPDTRGPVLSETLVEGGTGLLKDQAHCPFRAFVHHRLHGRALDLATPGISAMVRGDLVHMALEKIWQQLQDQANLVDLSDAERQHVIADKVGEALAAFFGGRPVPPATLLQLEQERIAALVDEWLQTVETEREPFRVVGTEQQHEEQLGPLQIRLKVDRIDEVAGSHRVVIDYKTGSQLRADDLVSDPLIEPQLPIYAVAQGEQQADGIIFAQVRRGSCRLLGIVKEKGLLGRVGDLAGNKRCQDLGISEWTQLLAFWRQQVRRLADEFVAGEASVRPFDPATSCRYCDLPGLCRIQESLLFAGVDDDC